MVCVHGVNIYIRQCREVLVGGKCGGTIKGFSSSHFLVLIAPIEVYDRHRIQCLDGSHPRSVLRRRGGLHLRGRDVSLRLSTDLVEITLRPEDYARRQCILRRQRS